MIFTWSMAQGMRQRISLRVPKICGKEVGKHGAACTAGKAILPMLSSCVIPIRLRMEFIVTDVHMQYKHLIETHLPGVTAAQQSQLTILALLDRT